MRRRIDQVSGALGLLTASESTTDDAPDRGDDLRGSWLATLAQLADRTDLHGLLLGRIVRLLLDAEVLTDVAVRVERALSHGVEAARQGRLGRGLLRRRGAAADPRRRAARPARRLGRRAWTEREFADLLPLVRRTFGTFSPAERRTLAGRISAGDDR